MFFGRSETSPILFGVGAVGQVGDKARELGCTRIIVISDSGVQRAGITEKVSSNLRAAGIEVTEYNRVPSDPPDTTVEECAALAREARVDGILGVGGGSVLDTAKAVNVLVANPPPISRYYDPAEPQERGKPLILIPTTSGTGSEVTSASVVTDSKTGGKMIVFGPNCRASLALVDPELTVGLPPSVTAATGMDAFAHAAEALTSQDANPISDILAERVIGLVSTYLPAAVTDGSDLVARTYMSLAATLGGLAFKDALCHIGHAISLTLGAWYHIPHGTGVAIALPGTIECVSDVLPHKVRLIGQAMGLVLPQEMPALEVGKRVADAVRALARRVGIPSLRDLHVPETAITEIAEDVPRREPFTHVPKEFTPEEIAEVVRSAFAF